MRFEDNRVRYMSEMLLLLNYGPLPRNYVRDVFKNKGYTYADFERTAAFMGLIEEKWNGVKFIRKPTLQEKENQED